MAPGQGISLNPPAAIVFRFAKNRYAHIFSEFIIPWLCQIYSFTCGSYSASYIGKTFTYMKVRVLEHQGVSSGTGEQLNETFSTYVRDRMLDCNHIVACDDLKVLGRESNQRLLEIKESLFIKRDRPSLSNNIYSGEFLQF